MTDTTRRRKNGKGEPVMSHDPLADLGAQETDEPVPVEPVSDHSDIPPVAQSTAAEPAVATSGAESSETPSGETAGELDLGSCLTIREVGEWHERLAGLCDLGEELTLNGGAMEQIDGAGIQLLAAFIKEACHMHVDINWSAVSTELAEAARVLGLTHALHIQEN